MVVVIGSLSAAHIRPAGFFKPVITCLYVMLEEIPMSNIPSHSSRFPSFRRLWKPALATGAGGTTLAIWFEDIMAFATEIIGVILLAILGGLICLFDHFIFKSRMPRREGLKDTINKGKK